MIISDFAEFIFPFPLVVFMCNVFFVILHCEMYQLTRGGNTSCRL